jgi:16S rRNA G527 N7-methylase RsmG
MEGVRVMAESDNRVKELVPDITDEQLKASNRLYDAIKEYGKTYNLTIRETIEVLAEANDFFNKDSGDAKSL